MGLGDSLGADGRTAGVVVAMLWPGVGCWGGGGGLCFCGEKPGETGAFVVGRRGG